MGAAQGSSAATEAISCTLTPKTSRRSARSSPDSLIHSISDSLGSARFAVAAGASVLVRERTTAARKSCVGGSRSTCACPLSAANPGGGAGEAVKQTVEEWVRALRALRVRDLTAERVGEILQADALDPRSLRPWLRWRRNGYARNLLFRNERFELLALAWDAGSASPVHDHGGQRCFVSILEGAFEQEDFRIEDASLARSRAQVVPVGRPRVLVRGASDFRSNRDLLHRVTALTPGAISLHLYSRPVVAFHVFDVSRGRCALRRASYDSIAGISMDPESTLDAR